MKAEFIKREAYGLTRYYPKCEVAKLLCEVTGQTTLTLSQIKLVEKLNISIIVS